MKKTIALLALLGSAFAANVNADVILAATSFENDATGALYVDTGDAAFDHDLINNAGEADVDSTNLVGDLGFDASYVNTRGSNGLTDGDFVGVTDFTGTVTAFTDGVQGYQMSDADGRMDLTFDAVDISGQGSVTVSLDYFLAATGWESNDSLRVYLDVDGNETDLLNTVGSDIDDLSIEGAWNVLSTDVTGNSATLIFEFDSNAGTEAVFFDQVDFRVVSVPEPTSAILLISMVGFGLVRRRK